MDFPAYGVRNVRKVAARTGEALADPMPLRWATERPGLITGINREVGGESAGWRMRP
jgi:hypothetical protein